MIAASITIFDKSGHINDEEMEKLWKKNISEGVDGFFIGGSAGECFLLSTDERIHMFDLAGKALAGMDLYAHVGSVSTDHAIMMAKAALSCGITQIASTPPFYFAFTPKELACYFYDLAEAIGRPVLYYDIPSSTHADLNTNDPEIRALLNSGAIGAIKHTNLQSYRMKYIKAVNPDIKILGGFESKMVPMLNYHCDGFIGSTFNFMFPQYNRIIKLYHSPEKNKIYKIISDSTDILQVLLKTGLPASIKYILSHQGIDAGTVRRPLLPLDETARAMLDNVIKNKLIYNN